MRLRETDAAPDFKTRGPAGQLVELQQYRGKPLWLVLSRWANCPFCSLRLDRVARGFEPVREAGVSMLVIFPSPQERIQRYVEKYQPPFDVGADPDHIVFQQYGSETSWPGEFRSVLNPFRAVPAMLNAKLNPVAVDGDMHRMPADFLIDPDGVVAKVHYGAELDDGLDVATVVAWAQAAR